MANCLKLPNDFPTTMDCAFSCELKRIFYPLLFFGQSIFFFIVTDKETKTRRQVDGLDLFLLLLETVL